MDDATLLVDFAACEGQAIRPVLQNEDAGVECALPFCRHVANTIDRLVDRGVGVEVASELYSESTGELQECRVREVFRPVERHVLEEMGQTALVVILLNGAHTLRNVEVCDMFRPIVVADVVGQSVLKLAYAHVLVNGNLSHFLRGGYADDKHKRYYEKMLKSHFSSGL